MLSSRFNDMTNDPGQGRFAKRMPQRTVIRQAISLRPYDEKETGNPGLFRKE
jgi:hypothetical protein